MNEGMEGTPSACMCVPRENFDHCGFPRLCVCVHPDTKLRVLGD